MFGRGGLIGRRAAAAPVPERRRSVRHTVLAEVARLVAGARAELCMLRDVSPGGLRVQVYRPLAAGERIGLELRTGHHLAGHVAWAEDDLVGIAFDAEVPIGEMLSRCSFDDRVIRIRPPRIEVDLPATLLVDERPHPVRVANLSLAGVQLSGAGADAGEGACLLAADGLAPRPAQVRWHRAGAAGLQFDEPLSFADFGTWRAASPG